MSIRQQDICSIKLQKGRVEGYSFTSLDYVGPCKGEECPIADECIYWQNNSRIATCRVEGNYLRGVHETFMELVEKVPDPFVMQWVGSHMMKLYHQLIKMQLEEMAIKGRLTYQEKGGKMAIHPVFREIREIIRSIRSEWRDSGLYDIAREHGFLGALTDPANARRIAKGGKVNPGAGDPGFYSRMKSE